VSHIYVVLLGVVMLSVVTLNVIAPSHKVGGTVAFQNIFTHLAKTGKTDIKERLSAVDLPVLTSTQTC
jgi:hypothetical protein